MGRYTTPKTPRLVVQAALWQRLRETTKRDVSPGAVHEAERSIHAFLDALTQATICRLDQEVLARDLTPRLARTFSVRGDHVGGAFADLKEALSGGSAMRYWAKASKA